MNMSSIVRYAVKQKIEQLIDIGEKNKEGIYSRIEDDFGLNRVEIKKIARELRQEWEHKIRVLQTDLDQEQHAQKR